VPVPSVIIFLCIFVSDDHSRVVLSLREDEPGSDYINASHIKVEWVGSGPCLSICICMYVHWTVGWPAFTTMVTSAVRDYYSHCIYSNNLVL